MTNAVGSTASGVVQGGITTLVVLYFNHAIELMVPFLILTAVLILVDLFFGVEAAAVRYRKHHKEEDRPRPSRAIRKTIGKVFEYLCWVILAASLSVSFDQEWISIAVMAFVVMNEIISVIDNYLCVHNKRITGLWPAFFRLLGKRLDADLSGVKVEEIKEEEQ